MADKMIFSLVLSMQKDADIIRWLNTVDGSKSEAIRAAIRAHMGTQGITLGDVYQAVREIDRKLARGAFVANTEGSDAGDLPDEPPDIAVALDNLGW
jgi:hypothetical protein